MQVSAFEDPSEGGSDTGRCYGFANGTAGAPPVSVCQEVDGYTVRSARQQRDAARVGCPQPAAHVHCEEAAKGVQDGVAEVEQGRQRGPV